MGGSQYLAAGQFRALIQMRPDGRRNFAKLRFQAACNPVDKGITGYIAPRR
jgi:hypothetical protein